MRKKLVSFLLALLMVFTVFPTSTMAKTNYKTKMITTLTNLRKHIKTKNKNFKMITNGGFGLYCPDINESAASRKKFFNAVDGVLIEDIWYGWDCKLNKGTPKGERKDMLNAMKAAKKAGKPRFNIEYCNGSKASTALKNSSANGLVCYPAPDVDLRSCPGLAANRTNANNITSLGQVKNFMILLDPARYQKAGKAAYLNALKNTNYDMIFIDLYFNGKALTKADVNSLKYKKNGKRRLVCSYISVGEAENYRYYWKKTWNKKKNRPSWIVKQNPHWKGNYVVKFWDKNWTKILNGYSDRVIAAGFDGAYMDVIEAFEHFE